MNAVTQNQSVGHVSTLTSIFLITMAAGVFMGTFSHNIGMIVTVVGYAAIIAGSIGGCSEENARHIVRITASIAVLAAASYAVKEVGTGLRALIFALGFFGFFLGVFLVVNRFGGNDKNIQSHS